MSMEDIFSDAGREILDSVTRAIETNNYTNLGNELRDTVSHTAGTIRETVNNNTVYQSGYVSNSPRVNTPPMPGSNTPPMINRTFQTPFRNNRTPFMPRYVSNGGNIAKSVVGGITTFGLGVATFSMGVRAFVVGMTPGLLIGMSTVGVLLLSAFGLFRSGIKGNKLLSRYKIYGTIVGNQEYISIDHLANASGFSTKQVLSDIQRLHIKNIIPYATFDKDRKTLMLTDNVYKEYQRTEAARLSAAKEDALLAQKAEDDAMKAGRAGVSPEVQELLNEGHSYLRKVRDYNDMIPDDQEMSNKLYELEDIMKRIFDKVQTEPKSAGELRRFMSYYLPTTEKLLVAYVDIQNQGGEGENVRNTRYEIEDAMNVINQAFANLLDQMFQRTAWDVSSDISVMKTMMAQDGLTENAMAEMHE